MERQSNRVSEQQRCAPSLHYGRGPSALLLHALYRTRPLCTPAPCLHRTRPFYTPAPCPLPDQAPSARTFLLQIKPSAEPTTLHADKDIANRQLSPISI